MEQKEKETRVIGAYVPVDLAADFVRLCKREERTVSEQLRYLIRQALIADALQRRFGQEVRP